MKYIVFLLLSINFYSQEFSGVVSTENGYFIKDVLVINLKTNQKVFSNHQGHFVIPAKAQDEIRFVKERYERGSYLVLNEDFANEKVIILTQLPTDIQEVEIKGKLSGNLKTDALALTKENLKDKLNKDIGLPHPIKKPKPKPAELTKDVFVPMLLGNLNIQAVYDLISGDARRLRNLYKYEDMQANIQWIRKKLPNEYFIDIGIPLLKINEFLQFSILVNSDIVKYIQANNVERIIFALEAPAQEYTSRLQK